MKHYISAIVMGIAISTFSVAASAQDSGAYINVGIDTLNFEAYGIGGKVGYDLMDYVAVEVQGSVGVVDEKDTIGSITAKAGYDYIAGAFSVLKLPLSENFQPFVRTGYYFTELSASAAGQSQSVSFDGFAVGGGAQFMWDSKNGIRAEYTLSLIHI